MTFSRGDLDAFLGNIWEQTLTASLSRGSTYRNRTTVSRRIIPTSAGVVDLTFDSVSPRVLQANVKSKTTLESYICWWSHDSNIRKSGRRAGVRMLESDR